VGYGAVAPIYVAAEWAGVLPLPARSKKAPPSGTTGADAPDPTSEQIAAWQRDFPTGNIALRMPERMIGMDVDDSYAGRDGEIKQGLLNLVRFAADLGLSELPRTWSSTSRPNTASAIAYYRTRTVGPFRDPCDDVEVIQRGHRYSVVPPSIAPPPPAGSGAPYVWIRPDGQVCTDGTVPRPEDLPELPADWEQALSARAPSPRRSPEGHATDYVPDLDSPADFFSATHTWPELLERDGWTWLRDDAAGESFWQRPGAPGRDHNATIYPLDDRLHVWTSKVPSLEFGEAYTRFQYEAAVNWEGDTSDLARHIRLNEMPGIDEDDPDVGTIRGLIEHQEAQQQPEAERLATMDEDERSAIEAAAMTGPSPAIDPEAAATTEAATKTLPADLADRAHLVDWGTFWETDHDSEDWIVPSLIPTGRAVALYAPAKAGKSILVLAGVAAAATGRPVFGEGDGTMRHILYCDYEMGEADLQERLEELGYGPEDDLSHLHYATLPSLPPLDTAEGAMVLRELASLVGAEAVIIDTIGRAVAGEENSADTIRNFFRHTGLALKTAGIAVLRTDHSGKDSGRGQRGSSAKVDDVDVVWRLERKEGGLTLHREQHRVSWIPERLDLLRVEDSNGVVHFQPVQDSYVDGAKELAAKLKELGLPVGAKRKAARKVLQENGLGARNDLLGSALKWMRRIEAHAGPPSGPGTAPGTAYSDSPGPPPGPLGDHLQNPWSQDGTAPGTDGDRT
jgi:hypothetical protein